MPTPVMITTLLRIGVALLVYKRHSHTVPGLQNQPYRLIHVSTNIYEVPAMCQALGMKQ